MSDEVLFSLLFLVPTALGIRATYRLWRIYLFDDESRRQTILLGFAVIATILTVTALWFGFVTFRRLVGFDPLPWSPAVSIVLAAIVLLIPAGLERLVDYVGREPPEG